MNDREQLLVQRGGIGVLVLRRCGDVAVAGRLGDRGSRALFWAAGLAVASVSRFNSPSMKALTAGSMTEELVDCLILLMIAPEARAVRTADEHNRATTMRWR